MILVTGATGNVGGEVVRQLLAAGVRVRALVRDASKAKLDLKVDVAVGDFTTPDSLAKAVAGVEKVFSLAVGPQGPAHELALAIAAKKAGVSHIVGLSVLGAGSGGQNAILQWHDAGERAIRESGVAWTFVRPGGFMSNARNWIDTVKSSGKVFAPYGDGKTAPIHTHDIAAVVVKALTGSGHEGKSYSLTGDEALTTGEQVHQLSEAVGKPIEYVSVSDEAARGGMLKSGMPSVLVEALIQMGAAVRGGHMAEVLPTVQEVTGQKPRTFASWAKENAGAFR